MTAIDRGCGYVYDCDCDTMSFDAVWYGMVWVDIV